jgi:tRNA pseudouridine55 synthase
VDIDGILNLDKPARKTSFDVVAAVRKLSGVKKVGHGGTLDPDATGVLLICLGQATRLVEYLIDTKKSYRAEIELGIATDTYDATGSITRRGDPSGLTIEKIEEAAASFKGVIEQIPPMYSAVKHQGIPLYKYARAGVELQRTARNVEFYRIEVLGWHQPVVTLEVECGKGAYIRSLAQDLGEILRCGAHLKNLIRLSSGPFNIGNSVTISQVENAFDEGRWEDVVYPIDMAVNHLPCVSVDRQREEEILNGRAVILEQDEVRPGELLRAYSLDGRLIAIMRYDDEQCCWRPKKVFVKQHNKA